MWPEAHRHVDRLVAGRSGPRDVREFGFGALRLPPRAGATAAAGGEAQSDLEFTLRHLIRRMLRQGSDNGRSSIQPAHREHPGGCRRPSRAPSAPLPTRVAAARTARREANERRAGQEGVAGHWSAASARCSPNFTSPAMTFRPGCVDAMVAMGSMAVTTALPSSPS